ncbi:MAG: hypothetical protein Q4B42_03605 [Oscillospiraceae bacterium]|nr:hypothetical protein [Oscillospiraceae bacterium]
MTKTEERLSRLYAAGRLDANALARASALGLVSAASLALILEQ